MPQGCEVLSRGWTRREVFANVCSLSLGSFVDWKNGVCRFDTGEFADLLRFTELFPEEYEGTTTISAPKRRGGPESARGRQMLRQMYINSLYSYSYDASLYGKAGMTPHRLPLASPAPGAVFSIPADSPSPRPARTKTSPRDFISYCLDPITAGTPSAGCPPIRRFSTSSSATTSARR